MPQLPQVDALLKAATDRGDVPGVVAMAATREGPVYQGAFGKRAFARRPGGDPRYGVLDRLDDQGDYLDRGDAAR